jgi:hypothetical protein
MRGESELNVARRWASKGEAAMRRRGGGLVEDAEGRVGDPDCKGEDGMVSGSGCKYSWVGEGMSRKGESKREKMDG